MSQALATGVPAGSEPFMAFVNDEATLDILQAIAVARGWRPDACKKGNLRSAVQTLAVAASPAMLLVDLSDLHEPLDEIESLAEVCEPGTIAFALGTINDVELYRALAARGIHDYLVKPVAADQLASAINSALATLAVPRDQGAEGENGHLCVGIVGARGGVGASMLATSLAWLFANESQRSTALLDLDVHFGTGALTLDLEPGRGLTDAIEDPARIDGLFIERAMVRADERLAILSSEASLNSPYLSDGTAFVRLENELRHAFDATILDIPRSIMLNFPALLAGVATIVIVCEMTLAAARDTIRMLSWLKSNAPHARVVVVANKVPPAAEISDGDFKAAIERPVDFSILFDHKGAIRAARMGQTFIEANRTGKVVAPLRELAQNILDPQIPAGREKEIPGPSNSLLGKLDFKNLLTRSKASQQNPSRLA